MPSIIEKKKEERKRKYGGMLAELKMHAPTEVTLYEGSAAGPTEKYDADTVVDRDGTMVGTVVDSTPKYNDIQPSIAEDELLSIDDFERRQAYLASLPKKHARTGVLLKQVVKTPSKKHLIHLRGKDKTFRPSLPEEKREMYRAHMERNQLKVSSGSLLRGEVMVPFSPDLPIDPQE